MTLEEYTKEMNALCERAKKEDMGAFAFMTLRNALYNEYKGVSPKGDFKVEGK